ncbi:MAG: hypothetical protein KF886_06165 [Candidatus Hydrogenedentes bacterium]|nr:hypothetical protein [Candidatus Hydrogenedentota bacterium]
MLAWLIKNWYIPLLVLGIAVAVIVGRLGSARDAAPPGGPGSAPDSQEALRAEFERAKAAESARGGDTDAPRDTDTVIAEHRAALESDAPSEETPARLAALGNLYRQKKQDYATAAGYFEQVIQNHPDWPGVNGVYHQLIACYTQLEDQPRLRLLYRKMLDVFPEDSNEYEFARHALENPEIAEP